MHCPECGFANAEGANYCQKCGAFLGDQAEAGGDTTEVYQVDETGELRPVDLDTVTHEGATLVIRSGGGRSGEAFKVAGERMTIGRSPDAEVFLDDVTVSRNHALLVQRRDGLYIDDLGSLNGTYVNRRRIESHRLQNGDELQVGKYKLTYLEER
jgi:pSer/pThr/pTyr-binding forkhead associated (FHA) protein